jgi:hypothetical protein
MQSDQITARQVTGWTLLCFAATPILALMIVVVAAGIVAAIPIMLLLWGWIEFNKWRSKC